MVSGAYFALRATQEMLAATKAERLSVKDLHRQLADHHLALTRSVKKWEARVREERTNPRQDRAARFGRTSRAS